MYKSQKNITHLIFVQITKKYYIKYLYKLKKGYCHRLTTNWAHMIVVVTPVGIEPTTTHPGEHLCFTPNPIGFTHSNDRARVLDGIAQVLVRIGERTARLTACGQMRRLLLASSRWQSIRPTITVCNELHNNNLFSTRARSVETLVRGISLV